MIPQFDFKYDGVHFGKLMFTKVNDNDLIRFGLPDGFYAELHKTEHPEYHLTEWVLWFGNDGDSDSRLLSDIRDLAMDLPLEADPPRPRQMLVPIDYAKVCYGFGSGADADGSLNNANEYTNEFQFIDCPMEKGRSFTLSPRGGRSSSYAYPFFDINRGESGYLLAIGWSGQWKAKFERRDTSVYVETGLERTRFFLHPGERVRTSSVILMPYDDGRENACNRFRRFIKGLSPLGHGQIPTELPMSMELWGGLSDKEMKQRIDVIVSKGIRFDYLWIDAGWHGNRREPCEDPSTGGWWLTTGDWFVNKYLHPENLRNIREYARNFGMKFLLWFETERARKTSDLYRKHPDWFLDLPECDDVLLDLSRDEVLNGITEILSKQIAAIGIDCYRQDFNIEPLPYWRAHDEDGREGIHEIRHIMNLYAMWDRLRERFPELLIDNCASGGRRIDIETLRRSVPLFRSDYSCWRNANPNLIQAQNIGAQRFVPLTGCATRGKLDLYTARSSYSAGWMSAHCSLGYLSLNEEELDILKQITEEYRQLRDFFSCDFYVLENAGANNEGWCTVQYDRPEKGDGMIMVFRRENSRCTDACYQLRLDPAAAYSFTDIDTDETYEFSARQLSEGFSVRMQQPYESKIITYSKISDKNSLLH